METSNGYLSNHQYSASVAASQRDVTYRLTCAARCLSLKNSARDSRLQDTCALCCGSCGYDLNLNSSSRNTSTIGSKYGKSMKKGIISFFSIDDNRFNQVEEICCVPYFISKHSWGLFRKRTKLSCRKCGNYVGMATDFNASSPRLITNGSDSPSSSEISNMRKYDIRIRSLQPSSVDIGNPFVS